jgi:hypothetical protein
VSYPLIGILGGSKSGKDTVAEYINEFLGGVNIAQADPMKRFAKQIFDFTDAQLWGPSENRNAVDHRGTDYFYWDHVAKNITASAKDFFEAWSLPQKRRDYGTWPERPVALNDYEAAGALTAHYDMLREHYRNTFSPRIQLQHFGTEFGRALDKNLWSRQAIWLAEGLLEGKVLYAREGAVGSKLGMVTGTRARMDHEPTPAWVTVSDVRFRNEALNIKAKGGLLVKVVNPEITGAVKVGLQNHASETELLSIPQSWMDFTLTNDKTLGLEALRAMVKSALRSLELL